MSPHDEIKFSVQGQPDLAFTGHIDGQGKINVPLLGAVKISDLTVAYGGVIALDKVSLESPALTCVVKDKPYAIAISIKGPDGAVLQEIDTTLMSTEDQSILPDRPLVIDQLYTANPDLAGHPDGKLPGEPKPDCSKGM